MQWHRGEWLEFGRQLLQHTSRHLVTAFPALGMLVSALGIAVIWPPAVVLVFLAGIQFLFVLLSSTRRESQREHAESSRPRQGRQESRRYASH